MITVVTDIKEFIGYIADIEYGICPDCGRKTVEWEDKEKNRFKCQNCGLVGELRELKAELARARREAEGEGKC